MEALSRTFCAGAGFTRHRTIDHLVILELFTVLLVSNFEAIRSSNA